MRLYNTLSRSEEPFAPGDGKTVRMYTCGLTVYARGHIGNFRTFVCVDVLRRTLRHLLGYQVRQVVNFTDVDDRTIIGAQKAGMELRAYTDQYIAMFRDDARALGLEEVEERPRATDAANLRAMADLIASLGKPRPHLLERRIDLFQDFNAAGIRQAGAARPRRDEAWRAGRFRQLREGRRARFRAVEGDQARRTDLECRRSAGTSGLASRVLGDGAAAARRGADRPARRRHRSDLSPSRERNCAERRRYGQAVLALLDARRVFDRRRTEDVEIARQHLHDSRRHREGIPSVGGSISAAVGALSQAAEFHLGQPVGVRRIAAPADRFSRPVGRYHRAGRRIRRLPIASRQRERRSAKRCRTISIPPRRSARCSRRCAR